MESDNRWHSFAEVAGLTLFADDDIAKLIKAPENSLKGLDRHVQSYLIDSDNRSRLSLVSGSCHFWCHQKNTFYSETHAKDKVMEKAREFYRKIGAFSGKNEPQTTEIIGLTREHCLQ